VSDVESESDVERSERERRERVAAVIAEARERLQEGRKT
jgi:hypothetical protein